MPHPSFADSAAALDKVRLNKQISECKNLLDSLLADGGWGTHPAATMWRGNEGGLVVYAVTCFKEFANARNGTAKHKSMVAIAETYGHLIFGWKFPDWMGNHEFHSSHRGRLLQKGRIDVIKKRFKSLGTGEPIQEFLQRFFVEKKPVEPRNLTVGQVDDLTVYFDDRNVLTFDNWYDQFDWEEKPSDTYIWPGEKDGDQTNR